MAGTGNFHRMAVSAFGIKTLKIGADKLGEQSLLA
jgi:hypothetical protein